MYGRGADPDPTANDHRGGVAFGMVSMATNFTTLPLYLSATQHIGAARPPLWVVALLLLLVTVVTLIPAWLPILLAAAPDLLGRLARRSGSTSRPHRVSAGVLVPVIACLVGGVYLVVHSLVAGSA